MSCNTMIVPHCGSAAKLARGLRRSHTHQSQESDAGTGEGSDVEVIGHPVLTEDGGD